MKRREFWIVETAPGVYSRWDKEPKWIPPDVQIHVREVVPGDRVVSAEQWEELTQIIDTVERGYLDLSRWVLEVEEEQG